MASIELSRYEAEEGDLPDVCMCCGEEATERKRRRFISHPLWVFLLLPFIPIYLIVSILLTEDIRCYTLFCPRHKNYFLVRSLFVWGSLVVVLALIVGGFVLAFLLSGQVDKSKESTLFGSLCIGTVVLFMGWLVSIPISQVTAIHPANATRSRLILKRVSPLFVEAVLQYRENHALEAQPADYQEHFRPRRSRQRYEDSDDERIEPA
ncbi:MAG TPA: hypothetical protein VE999_14415 [Gemmataceae bacterium]|nr:hypothetical protein [Gemmataceae bacterium]